MSSDLDSRDPLDWLSQILWPDGLTRIQPGSPATGDTSSVGHMSWWASPSADEPRVLIPANSKLAARTAVTRYHDGFSTKRRLRSVLAENLTRNQRLASLTLGRTVVHAFPDASGGVLDEIAAVIGVADLKVAVSLSTPKSNQKPVLQLLDGSGRCHGWAKVAWNERTASLVGNEAHWLRWAEAAPHRTETSLEVPRVLEDKTLSGRRVVITSGVSPSRRPYRSADAAPPPEIFRAVAALGEVAVSPITETAWWRSVGDVLEFADPRERRAIDAVVEAVADLQFETGAWHGDVTPWNLMTAPNRVQLIDWEFAAAGAPLGFDLCHFHTQVASEMKAQSPARSLDRSARLSPQGLAELGVAGDARWAVWQLYLVELIRRSAALRAEGYPTDNVHFGAAAIDRLERIFGTSKVGASVK